MEILTFGVRVIVAVGLVAAGLILLFAILLAGQHLLNILDAVFGGLSDTLVRKVQDKFRE